MPSGPPEIKTPFDDGALYDILFDGFDYGLDFYLELARSAGGPVLDVACGTGRVLLPCLQAGLDVGGVDPAAGMLTVVREKGPTKGFWPPGYEGGKAAFPLRR